MQVFLVTRQVLATILAEKQCDQQRCCQLQLVNSQSNIPSDF